MFPLPYSVAKYLTTSQDFQISDNRFFKSLKFNMSFLKDWLLWFFPNLEPGISFTVLNLIQTLFVASCCLFGMAMMVSNPPLMIVCGVLAILIAASFAYAEKLSEIEMFSISITPEKRT
jgi:hypothetical protein